MDHSELTRLITKVRSMTASRRIIIFGSTSLLGAFPDCSPAKLGVEVTLDADIFLDPDDASVRALLVEQFGADRSYHGEHGRYADFVDFRASGPFPSGWQSRLIPLPGLDDVFVLDPIDVAANKLIACAQARVAKRLGRREEDRGTKDIDTVAALIGSGLIDASLVEQRLAGLDFENAVMAEATTVFRQTIVQSERVRRTVDH